MLTIYLNPAEIHLEEDSEGTLFLQFAGERRRVEAPRRALPVSLPEKYIVFTDAEGNEIGVLRDPDALDENSRQLLLASLSRTYHVEYISRILQVEKDPLTGQVQWRVELENREDDVSAPEIIPEATPDAEESRGWFRRGSRSEGDAVPTAAVREHAFTINGMEDVMVSRYPRIFIVDIEAHRYCIANCEALDLDSRRTAEQFF